MQNHKTASLRANYFYINASSIQSTLNTALINTTFSPKDASLNCKTLKPHLYILYLSFLMSLLHHFLNSNNKKMHISIFNTNFMHLFLADFSRKMHKINSAKNLSIFFSKPNIKKCRQT